MQQPGSWERCGSKVKAAKLAVPSHALVVSDSMIRDRDVRMAVEAPRWRLRLAKPGAKGGPAVRFRWCFGQLMTQATNGRAAASTPTTCAYTHRIVRVVERDAEKLFN